MEGEADLLDAPSPPRDFPPSPPPAPDPPPPPPPSGGPAGYDGLVGRAGVGFGRHQRLLCALTCLPVPLAAAALLADAFYTLVPPHRCRLDPGGLPGFLRNATPEEALGALIPRPRDGEGAEGPSSCRLYRFANGTRQGAVPCPDGWDYAAGEGLRTNIVTQWDLVCDSSWNAPVEEVCLILGCLTGYLLMGYSADRLGRRNTFIISLTLSILFGTLVAVSRNAAMFILARFFQGSSIAGLFLSLYLIRLELCDPPHRLMVAMVAGFFAVGGQFLLLGLAVGCRDWRILQGIITAPLALFFIYCCPWVLLESPRWLLATNQVTEAKNVLTVIMEKNGQIFDREPLELEESFTELDSGYPSQQGPSQQSICKLLKSRNIWKNILILGFTTFIGHGIHHCYGTVRHNVLGTNSGFYLTYLLSAGTGGLACLFLCFTVDRFGRRGILLLSMTLTGLASLILLGLTEYLNDAAIMTFSILGLFSSHAVAMLSVFFSAEVIPTVIRGEGLGLILALASVGQLSSPIMDLHNQHGYFLHHVVYASFAILCTLCIMLLPESKRKPLPESVRDGERYRRPSLLRRRRDNVPLLTAPNPTI
uniref:solute carrier family 22 member 17-like n=1 Tax=Pristiophorus japonicus TaxID=55135 RepID=UPI00398EB534